jgi:hypothetical protein
MRPASALRVASTSQDRILLPPGEGAGRRMRVRPERCTSLLRSARTLTPALSRREREKCGGVAYRVKSKSSPQFLNVLFATDTSKGALRNRSPATPSTQVNPVTTDSPCSF